MKSIKIATIPVYLYSQKTFEDRFKRRYIQPLQDRGIDEERLSLIEASYYPKNVWRFNQIMGYAVVYIEKSFGDQYEVAIEKWRLGAKRIGITTRKDRMRHAASIGDHFIVEDWGSEYLGMKIKRYIENDDLFKNRYIDYSDFDQIIEIIDCEKLKLRLRS